MKEGNKKTLRIQHNSKLFWAIIILIVILIFLVYFIEKKDKEWFVECKTDNDCIAATCCHPDSCVPAEKAPDCKNIMCSMVCSGPLDCGAGSCGCVDNKCKIIPNK